MTTREQIEAWFDQGVSEGYSHMLIVVDEFDHEDYPSYVQFGDNPQALIAAKNAQEMCRVMECYDLTLAKGIQLAERHSMHTDVRTASAPRERVTILHVAPDPLEGLNAAERAVALAAVETLRAEVEAERVAAEKRGTPTWRNTFAPENRLGMEDVIHSARLAGYTFFVWNEAVYPTEKATDRGIASWDDVVCTIQDLT